MSEEEIIKDIENMLNYNPKIRELSGMEILSISKLLKLCNKQKEEIERLKNEEEYSILGKETLLDAIHKQQKEIEELKKYDYRNIKINKDNEIYSIHFTKEQLDLMNLGISLYIGIPKIFEESEESDI